MHYELGERPLDGTYRNVIDLLEWKFEVSQRVDVGQVSFRENC